MAKSNSSIWVSLGLNTDQFKKGIKGAKGSMSSLKGGLNALSPVSLGVAGALAGIGLAVGNAVKTFKEFEKANSGLEAVLGASESEMSLLSEQAKILGSTTAFTASQVTELQTSLSKLGFDSSEIQNMTASTLAAAAALGSDLGEQATLTGATLKSFGLDSSEAARVNDVLAKSAASSALDFGKLSVALPIVGAVAKATGLSLERTTAILGTLTNNGLDASSSATALRNILIKLKEKGLTWNQAMEQINNSTDKTKTSFDLFGKTSTAAGVILANQGTTLDQLTTSLNKADGAAQDMADTMLNNLSGDVTKANSAWEGFVLDLEDGNGRIAVAMRSIVQSFTGMLETFKEDDIADSLGLSRGLFQELGATEQALVDLSASTGSLASKFASGKTSIAQFMTQTIALRKKQGELNRETETGNAKWLIYEDLINKLNKQATVLAEKNTKLAKEVVEVGDAAEGSSGRIKKFQESIENISASGSFTKMADEIKASLGNKGLAIRVPVEVTGVQTALANAKFFNEQIKVLEADQKQRDLDKIEQGRETAAAVGQAFSTIGASMVANLGLAEGAMGAFQATMAQLAIDLIAQALSTSIANAIIAGTASGAASGPAAAFVTPALIASTVGSVIGAFASIPAFATGVNNFSGGTALVGELGPELVNLPRGSDVIPNNKLGDMGGSGGGVLTTKVSGSDLVFILNREAKNNKFS